MDNYERAALTTEAGRAFVEWVMSSCARAAAEHPEYANKLPSATDFPAAAFRYATWSSFKGGWDAAQARWSESPQSPT